jgi:lipopolysaccharide biosynthesis regulator YciM
VRYAADRVETLLHVLSDGDEVIAAAILLVALSYRRMAGVKKALEVQLEKSIDHEIVDNVSAFLRHHNTKGRRSKGTQNALDAVLVAATFGSASESVTVLSKRLDMRPKSIATYVGQGQDMRSKETAFVPSETKQRSDCYRLPALKAVRAFCHSEEGGRDDTDSKLVILDNYSQIGRTVLK